MKSLKKLLALIFSIAGVAMLWQGGGFIWLGFFSLVAGLLILIRPDGENKADPAALPEYDDLRYGHPSRAAARSDYVLHNPTDGGPGDGGTV